MGAHRTTRSVFRFPLRGRCAVAFIVVGVFAQRLIDRLDASEGRWPLREEQAVWEQLSMWIAFRESDRERLRDSWAQWTNEERPYLVDPVPRKISQAFAQLLFGSPVMVTAATQADQARLDGLGQQDDLSSESSLSSELQRAEMVCSSEGEVWWRSFIDPEVADVPLLEWHSRTSVLPLWAGTKLRAAAFISRYDVGIDSLGNPTEIYRHFEVHDRGSVSNVLYRSTREQALGTRVSLEGLEDTMALREQWDHGLPGMLCGRIPNMLGVDPTLGVSDYDGIQDLLHMVNEATALQAENARLAGKYRSVVDETVLDEHGNFDASKEVLIAQSANRGLGEGGSEGPFKILQYTYQAGELIAHKDGVVNTALSRVGIVPQYVGAGSVTEGLGVSGTALRVRLIPTTAAGEERGQYWDGAIPRAIGTLQLLDSLPVESGGFGRPWSDPASLPSVERGSTLPVDETEEVAKHSDAVAAGIESRQTAVQARHPGWSDEEVAAELGRIRDDQAGQSINPFGPGDGAILDEEQVFLGDGARAG